MTKQKNSQKTSKSRRNLYIALGLIIFIGWWILVFFLNLRGAFALVLFLGTISFLFKGLISRPKQRKVYYFLAGIFLFFGVLVADINTPTSPTSSLENKPAAVEEVPSTNIPVQPTSPPVAIPVPPAPVSPEPALISGPTLTNGPLYRVVSVVDGDTIKVSIDGKRETIRFIGMDTPETKDPRKPVQCYGPEAYSRMQHYAQSKMVRLESDSSQGDRDKYSRLLRYVYTEDGQNIAYLLIREGYAREYTYSKPYNYQKQFREAQNQAKQAGLGLWSASTCSGGL